MIVEDPDRAVAELEQYALNSVNTYVARGFVQHAPFETIHEAVDEGLYKVWDGATAVSEIAAAVIRHPVVEEVLFLVGGGPGEPVANSYPRLQHIIDYVVPGVRKKIEAEVA